MGDRNRLFISYSHDDTKWLNAVTKQLKVLQSEGLVSICDDGMIRVGDSWFDQLHEMMLTARLGLLLVSAPFLSSDFVRNEEVKRLFDKHEAGGMTIYPLLVESCPWEQVAWLRRLQLRPEDSQRRVKPLSTFQPAARKQKIADVANEIALLVQSSWCILG